MAPNITRSLEQITTSLAGISAFLEGEIDIIKRLRAASIKSGQLSKVLRINGRPSRDDPMIRTWRSVVASVHFTEREISRAELAKLDPTHLETFVLSFDTILAKRGFRALLSGHHYMDPTLGHILLLLRMTWGDMPSSFHDCFSEDEDERSRSMFIFPVSSSQSSWIPVLIRSPS